MFGDKHVSCDLGELSLNQKLPVSDLEVITSARAEVITSDSCAES